MPSSVIGQDNPKTHAVIGYPSGQDGARTLTAGAADANIKNEVELKLFRLQIPLY